MFHYVVEIAIEPFQEPGSESLAEGSVSLYPSGLAEPFQLEGRFILVVISIITFHCDYAGLRLAEKFKARF